MDSYSYSYSDSDSEAPHCEASQGDAQNARFEDAPARIRRLLDADPATRPDARAAVLQWAAMGGFSAIAARLIAEGVYPPPSPGACDPFLEFACASGQAEVVRLLLRARGAGHFGPGGAGLRVLRMTGGLPMDPPDRQDGPPPAPPDVPGVIRCLFAAGIGQGDPDELNRALGAVIWRAAEAGAADQVKAVLALGQGEGEPPSPLGPSSEAGFALAIANPDPEIMELLLSEPRLCIRCYDKGLPGHAPSCPLSERRG